MNRHLTREDIQVVKKVYKKDVQHHLFLENCQELK